MRTAQLGATFLGACSMSGVCPAAVPVVDDASISDSTIPSLEPRRDQDTKVES